jgi:hypothetical protein
MMHNESGWKSILAEDVSFIDKLKWKLPMNYMYEHDFDNIIKWLYKI